MVDRKKSADAEIRLRLSLILRLQAEKKAEQMGMTLSEYVRYLIRRDTENK